MSKGALCTMDAQKEYLGIEKKAGVLSVWVVGNYKVITREETNLQKSVTFGDGREEH